MKKLIALIFLFAEIGVTIAQNNGSETGLLKYAENKAAYNKQQRAETIRMADSLGLVMRTETGYSIIELSHFVNGFPRFIGTTNNNAAATTAASMIWPGGGAGLNLTGSGITLAIWDGGRTRTDHQEFGSRVTIGDGTVSISSHATHVSGTMMATGVDPLARGMSYQANLLSYDWNDDEPEMATAAANSLQVSNHSYGYFTGWSNNYRGDGKWVWFGDTTVSVTADYGFGAYEWTSHDWDTIAWLAPNYLIVKSSGNDRLEGPVTQPVLHWLWNGGTWVLSSSIRERDGGTNGYDCIPWQGVAKNILTIGAVNDIPAGYQSPANVVLASFSDTGPADDGRIKPDLVANGTSLYSTTSTSTTSYGNMTGTSMSTPNASGSIGLLLEHRKNLTGNSSIRSATVKGLLIHTANEAGSNAGPDYNFGWGLLDTRKSALLMSEDAGYGFDFNLRELELNQGDTIRIPVYTNGTQSLNATICWTDRPSNVFTGYANDPTPMLVNDLDIRLISDVDEVTMPWKLSVSDPAAAATTGDNTVDNVEKIEAGSPTGQRTYLLQITHKGTLDLGSQLFSLIISGITTPPATTTWTGQVSSDWHTTGNWSNGIPGAETEVLINDVTNHIPVINASAWCHHLTIGTEGALTVTEGKKLTVKGDLLIQSDAGDTGSYIGDDPDVTGSKSIERYINGFSSALDGWHLLSSPVSEQPISMFHTPGTGNDFFKWDENSGLWINRTAPGGTLNNAFESNFETGRGYLIANSTAGSKLFSGPFNTESVNLTDLTRNSGSDYAGWNLVGNPFSSAIVWNDGNNWAVPADFAGVAKVWDEAGAAYIDRGAGEIIPSGNGFMVQLLTGTSGSLSIPSVARTHHAQNWFKSTYDKLLLSATNSDQNTAQQTLIAFRDDATDYYDKNIDSRFLEGFAPVFYTVNGGEFLSTNSLPSIPYGSIIQLGFSGKESHNFSIGLSECQLSPNAKIYLIDEQAGVVTDLVQTRIYNFTSSYSDDPYRFKLFFANNHSNNPDDNYAFNVYSGKGTIYIASPSDKDLKFNIADAIGKQVFHGHTGGKNLISVNANNFASGLYIVSLADGNHFQSEKLLLK